MKSTTDQLMEMIDAYAFGYSHKDAPGVRRDELKVAIQAAINPNQVPQISLAAARAALARRAGTA